MNSTVRRRSDPHKIVAWEIAAVAKTACTNDLRLQQFAIEKSWFDLLLPLLTTPLPTARETHHHSNAASLHDEAVLTKGDSQTGRVLIQSCCLGSMDGA